MKQMIQLTLLFVMVLILSACTFMDQTAVLDGEHCELYPEDSLCEDYVPDQNNEDQTPTCNTGYVLTENGTCELENNEPLTCEDGYHVEDGNCVQDTVISSTNPYADLWDDYPHYIFELSGTYDAFEGFTIYILQDDGKYGLFTMVVSPTDEETETISGTFIYMFEDLWGLKEHVSPGSDDPEWLWNLRIDEDGNATLESVFYTDENDDYVYKEIGILQFDEVS